MLNRSFSANQQVNLLDIDLFESQPTVGRKLENLSIEEIDDFNPRASNNSKNKTMNGNTHINGEKDVFGCEPFVPKTDNKDPFGMVTFEACELEEAIGNIDKKLAEMRVSDWNNLY